MSAVSAGTALAAAYRQIVSAPGSPYFKVSAILKGGGASLTPAKVVDLEIGQAFTTDFADTIYLTVEMGLGDAIYGVAPYAEDLRVNLTLQALDENLRLIPGVGYKRTYTAYLASEIPTPSTIGGNPILRDRETANRQGFVQLAFKLEETATIQFKRMSFGAVFEFTVPWTVPVTFLDHAIKRLKLSQEEQFSGIDIVQPDNTAVRSNIIIPDGTKLMSIPDYVQNKEGGIYNTGLGFYTTGGYIYLWPLYNTKRIQSADRVLRVHVAQDTRSSLVDHTWRVEGRRVDVWCKSDIIRLDDTVGQMNKQGTGVRYMDTNRLLNQFAEVGDGKLIVKKGLNNNEFAYKQPINEQQNVVWGARATTNTFYESSVMAKQQGSLFQVIWDHSNPYVLFPNMAVEIVYIWKGVSKKITGSLINVLTKITTATDRLNNRGSVSQTSLIFFVDQNDPAFDEWVQSGAVGRSTAPQID